MNINKLAFRIVQDIQADLNDRQGFDLSGLDEDVEEEITAAWEKIVSEAIEAYS